MSLPAPAFRIRERTGARRGITLKGRALPYRPIEFSIDQRVDISSPAGMHGGVSTILGPTYGTSTFQGAWKDKYLGATLSPTTSPMTMNLNPVSSVIDADRLMTSIIEQGQELDVWWGPIYRRGHLKSWKPKWLNTSDLEWSMEFSWLSRGTTNVSLGQVRRPPSDLGNSLLERLTSALRNFRRNFQFTRDYQEALLRRTQQMGALTEELNNTVTDIESLNPFRLAGDTSRAVIVAAGNIATNADAVVESIRDTSPVAYMEDYWELAVPGSPIPGMLSSPESSIPVDRQLEATTASREQERLFRNMRNDANAYERARMTPDTDILGTYRTREGEDLRDVSRMYYATPMEWRRIMEFNELTTSEVDAGTLLVIPRGPAGEEQGDGV